MKKIVTAVVAALTLATLVPTASAAVEGRGGCVGGIVGCCWGIRTAAAWNEGKSINVREWLEFVYVGRIWAAIEGYQGVTTTDLHNSAPGYF